MFICHTHRFIFIKTRKTASSSVEIGLSRACGRGDVVTPLSVKSGDEALRAREGGFGPANWLKSIGEHRSSRKWRRLLFRAQRAQRFSPHTTINELQRLVPAETMASYFKFTLERNPWDRAVSRYFWQKHRAERNGHTNFPALGEYLRYLEREKPHWLSNWSHYTIGGRIAVDRVLQYEELSKELAALQSDLDIGTRIALPSQRAKGGYRTERQHYSELLSDADRRLVQRVCAPEIEVFGYRFEPVAATLSPSQG